MKPTLPGGEPKSIEGLLGDFKWKLEGLNQIAQTTLDLERRLGEPRLRRFLGMGIHTAKHVDSLVDEYDELRKLIVRRLDEPDREKETQPPESLEQPKSEAAGRKAFRGPRRVIEPAAGVLDQIRGGELRDLRDVVELKADLTLLFRIFGTGWQATIALDPSQVVQFYGSSSLFREAIDDDACWLAAVDLIDVEPAGEISDA